MRNDKQTSRTAPPIRRLRPPLTPGRAAALPFGSVPATRVFKTKGTYICVKDGLLINGELHRSDEPINTRNLSLARLRTLFDAGLIEPEG
jgi:hypothetical protein